MTRLKSIVPCELKRLGCLIGICALLAAPIQAQRDGMALRGRVVNSATNGALVQVAVSLNDRQRRFTDENGGFEITGIPAGDHRVRFSKIGFAEYILAVRFENSDIDLGVASLDPLQSRRMVFSGTVAENGTNQPVPRAAIILNGSTIAVTDQAGMFVAADAQLYETNNHVSVQVLGYDSADQSFAVPASENKVNIRVFLDRNATELEPVVIEAEEIPAHLREFERRRKAGLGRYITAGEIEQLNPIDATDILRRAPGVIVSGEVSRGTSVRFFRGGALCVEEPLIFLDGVFTPNLFIDAVLTPERIAGIELYSGPATVPAELQVQGSGLTGGTRAACGVIAFWTKAPELAGRRSPFEVGLRYGGALGSDRAGATRLGVHLVAPLIGPIELYPAFAISTGLSVSRRGIQTSIWFAQLAVRVRPLGEQTPWYAGSGLILSKPSLKVENVPANDFPNAPDVDPAHAIFTGFTYRFGPARPFVELHVLDGLGGSAKAEAFAGLGLQF